MSRRLLMTTFELTESTREQRDELRRKGFHRLEKLDTTTWNLTVADEDAKDAETLFEEFEERVPNFKWRLV